MLGGRRMLVWVLVPAVLAVPAVQGCLRRDPSHCANRAGDETCAEDGARPFCSICSAQSNGCVETEPGPNCYMPVGATVGSDGSTGELTEGPGSESGSNSTPSTTEPVDCTQDGIDEACPATSPFCIDGTCTPCSDADPELCAETDAATPRCHPGSGTCVACVEDGDCGQGVCGDDYTCVGCARHEDCPGTACDLEQRECLSTSAVFWVDPSGCGPPGPPAQDTGFGTPGQPYCWLGTALDNFPAVNKGVIFVTQGSAEPIEEDISIDTLGAVTIAVMGIDTPTIVGATTPAVVGGGATVYLHNLRLEEDAGGNGATCGGFGKLWITDVRVEGSNHAGIAADSCERLTVERSIIFGNRQGGISAAGSTVVMMSSALVQNGFAGGSTSALSANNSDLDIRYTTFAGNLGSINGAASLSCTNSTGELRNSIVTAPAAPSFDCPGLSVRTSAVDTELDDGDGVVTLPMYDASLFEALPARDVAPANPDDSPFADVAVWDVGDPLRDLGGPRRLAFPGRREFAGAVQP